MTPEERLASLKEAETKLREASELIENALHMSGNEMRFGKIPDEINEIIDSENGLTNLIRETEYADEEHPPWTRPFASPKNITRKDI
jgi:hypothetical protein